VAQTRQVTGSLTSAKVPVTLSATKGLGISLGNAGVLRFAQNDAGGAHIAL